MMRLFAAALAGVVCAMAQTPGTAASILVSAPLARVISGNTVEASAVARDSSGRTRSGDSFAWTTSNAAVATVDARGVVTARSLG